LSFDDEDQCQMTYAIINSLPLFGVKNIKHDDKCSSVPKNDEDIPKREQTQVEIERTRIFANECKELLQHAPNCRLSFDKFTSTYQQHFSGRQCKVADYGFAKLIELFEAISLTIEITKDADGKRQLQLNQTLQQEQNTKIMAEQKHPATEIAETFMQILVSDENESETATSTDDDTLQSLQEHQQLKIDESRAPLVVDNGSRVPLTIASNNASTNLATLQRIDPDIIGINKSVSHVTIYKFSATQEWEQTGTEGSLFVYERQCEPMYGFLVLNKLSTSHWIQLITADIDFDLQSPFVMYKTKDEEIFGLSFDDEETCQMVYTIIHSLPLCVDDTKQVDECSFGPEKDEDIPCESKLDIDLDEGSALKNKGSSYDLQQEEGIKMLEKPKSPTTKLADTSLQISVPEGNKSETTSPLVGDNKTSTFLQKQRQQKINEIEAPAEIKSGFGAPLTMPQLSQAIQHLLKTDPFFVEKLHEAYEDSLKYNVS